MKEKEETGLTLEDAGWGGGQWQRERSGGLRQQ
jgi:hypothetical protein